MKQNPDGSLAVTTAAGSGLFDASGNMRITLVDGSTVTGLYAPDGSMNVVQTTAQKPNVGGVYHPCGAMYGSPLDGRGGIQAANGSFYMDALWTPYTGSAVHLDFENRSYYWNGGYRSEKDFSAFTGGSFGTGAAKGYIPATDASHNVKIAWSSLNISAPFCMVSVFRPTSIGANMNLLRLWSDANNYALHYIVTTGVPRTFVAITAGTQAQVNGSALSANTVYSWASNIETNAIRASVNGANAGTADTSATLPAITELVVGHNGANTVPFLGSIRHLMLFTGSHDQTALNALTTAIQAAYGS